MDGELKIALVILNLESCIHEYLCTIKESMNIVWLQIYDVICQAAIKVSSLNTVLLMACKVVYCMSLM